MLDIWCFYYDTFFEILSSDCKKLGAFAAVNSWSLNSWWKFSCAVIWLWSSRTVGVLIALCSSTKMLPALLGRVFFQCLGLFKSLYQLLSLCNLDWIVWIIVNEKWGGIQTNGISVFCLCSHIRLEDPLVISKTDSCINLPLFSHEIFVLQTTIWRHCYLQLIHWRQFIRYPNNYRKGNDLIASDSWLIKLVSRSVMILEFNTVLQLC
jgi:hypothetical protein